MTRYVVFRENTEPIKNVYVPIGSLKPRQGPISIVWANAVGEPAIGLATEFQRDETGAISFEIEFRHPEKLDDIAREECFSLYAKDLVTEKQEERIITLDATIVQIYFMPLPGFPPAKNSRNLQAS